MSGITDADNGFTPEDDDTEIGAIRDTDLDFERLYEAARGSGLILVNGGMCHYHARLDRQVTIRCIIVTEPCVRIGTSLLAAVRQRCPGATSIVAKCPEDLPANTWYARKGFQEQEAEQSKKGRRIRVWRLPLSPS